MYRKLVVFLGTVAVCSALLPAQQITDTQEYNTYVACLGLTADPAKQIACIDDYLTKYPKSVVKETALDLKLTAQQKSNVPFMQTAADILAVNPNNSKALLVLSFVFNNTPLAATDPNFQQKLSDEEALAKRGIDQLDSMKKPENVSDADWAKSKAVTAATHYQSLALVADYRKDFPTALTNFKKAAELVPTDGTMAYRIADTYGKIALAATDEAVKTQNVSDSLWYYSRAVSIDGLNDAGKQQVGAYLANLYKRYHGTDEGLADLKSKAAGAPFPPGDFHVKTKKEMEPPPPPPPPPTPIPEDITTWPFSKIQETLVEGGDRGATVLTKLKAAGFGSEGLIVSAAPPAAPKTVKIAVLKKTQETADAFDVTLTLTAAHVGALAKGKKVEFEGTVKDFADGALVMTAGKVTVAAAPRPKPAGKK